MRNAVWLEKHWRVRRPEKCPNRLASALLGGVDVKQLCQVWQDRDAGFKELQPKGSGEQLMHRRERTEHLKSNIKYLIKSRGETQLSLCNASGLTRTTIYNILEGKVSNVQQSTIRKISDFFGVSYDEIETVDFEEKEIIESSISPQGNMNPAAVPIIKERLLMVSMAKRIGELVTLSPLTYYFGTSCNLIAVLLENEIPGVNEPGDLLIVQKGSSSEDKEKLVYDKLTEKLLVLNDARSDSDRMIVIGDIIEERFHVGL